MSYWLANYNECPYASNMKNQRRSNCPISFGLDIFGDKWSLLILRDIFFKGARHYREFLAAGEGIATNILASRLKLLVDQGLIEKQRDETNRRQYIYVPTKKGLELIPTLLEIVLWSANNDPETDAPESYVMRLRNRTDKDGAIQEIYEKFQSAN